MYINSKDLRETLSWITWKRQRWDELPKRISDQRATWKGQDDLQTVELPAVVLQVSRLHELTTMLRWAFANAVVAFLSFDSSPIFLYVIQINPWFTKLDFGVFYTLVSYQFPVWWEYMSSLKWNTEQPIIHILYKLLI